MGHAAGTIIQAAERAQRTIGNKLDVAAGRDFSESIGVCFLSEPALWIAADVRVKGRFVAAADVTLKEDAPSLLRITGKAERKEPNFQTQVRTPERELSLCISEQV